MRRFLKHFFPNSFLDKAPVEKIPALYSIYTDGGALHNGKQNCKASWAFVVPFPPEAPVRGNPRNETEQRLENMETEKYAPDEMVTVVENGIKKSIPVKHRAGPFQPLVPNDVHTNNKAELMAIIQALQWARQQGIKRVRIVSDSQYAIYCINTHVTNWQRKANLEYFANIDAIARFFDWVDFAWVAGHQEGTEAIDAKCNELADGLCRDVLGIPRSYRPSWNQQGMTANRGGFKPRRKFYRKRR